MVEAVSKLKSEMEKEKSSYVQVVGSFLLQHLESNPAAAEKVLVKGKTIAGSLVDMRKEAGKKKVGGVGVLSDAEGFAVVLKYFGIEGGPTNELVKVVEVAAPATPVKVEEVKNVEKSGIDFDVSLDDFL